MAEASEAGDFLNIFLRFLGFWGSFSYKYFSYEKKNKKRRVSKMEHFMHKKVHLRPLTGCWTHPRKSLHIHENLATQSHVLLFAWYSFRETIYTPVRRQSTAIMLNSNNSCIPHEDKYFVWLKFYNVAMVFCFFSK